MLRYMAFCAAGLTLFLSSTASAQSSFTSVDYVDGGEAHQYSGARFYSNDGRNYSFRVYGCEFDVQYPFHVALQDNAYVAGFLDHARRSEGQISDGLRFEMVAGLVNPRVILLGSERPAGFRCDTTGKISIIIIASSTTENGKAVLILGQAPTYAAMSPGDDPDRIRWIRFAMSQDFFTPYQAQQLQSRIWDITLAIFKAWVENRN